MNIAHDSNVLPQFHVPEDIVERFQEAIAEPARNGESDEAPAEELGDPVPAIVARREAHRRRLTATRAGRPRAPAPHDAHTTCATRATQQR